MKKIFTLICTILIAFGASASYTETYNYKCGPTEVVVTDLSTPTDNKFKLVIAQRAKNTASRSPAFSIDPNTVELILKPEQHSIVGTFTTDDNSIDANNSFLTSGSGDTRYVSHGETSTITIVSKGDNKYAITDGLLQVVSSDGLNLYKYEYCYDAADLNNSAPKTPFEFTFETPIVKTCAEAAAIAATLENNIPTEETYSITGYVTNTDGMINNGQQVFWMDDVKGENKTFYAYWCNLPDGETALKVGDKVTIVGNILKYGTTGEMKMVDVKIIERAQSQYKYTTYENWQIKYGNKWEWTENMTKVEEGLFKLEIYWEGTGFNVKSDDNPIKKDWYAPNDPDVVKGEEVIEPVTVDVYLRVIDDETLKIGIGVEPPVPGPTVDETGITVNGRKYGFPVRLVKEVK